MVKDMQVRRLFAMQNKVKYLYQLADLAGMSTKTARKYLRSGKLPSQLKATHVWRTRTDPFGGDWKWVEQFLKKDEEVIEAKSLFEALQREYPGKYQDGQLRTFQRRIKQWRALHGPGQEVFFPQDYKPGQWAESDFTSMNSTGITINKMPFDHMIYHFVLCYSNWETGTTCFSESYESLSKGLQNALWKLGAVPKYHRTDNLRAAVNPVGNPEIFHDSYRALCLYYGLDSAKIQPDCPNENGDVEQRHYRFKRAVEQALIIRGSRDFASREDYEQFLEGLFRQLNSGRQKRLAEELKVMRGLPAKRLEDFRKLPCRVSRASTIRVLKNTYSLHSRLIGEVVEVRIHADYIEVWYAQRKVEAFPRLKGENNHRINYRHVIDTLVRKPGAFESYRYKQDMFPTSQFRIAYDILKSHYGAKQGNKQYLKILELAANRNESLVNDILRFLIDQNRIIDAEEIQKMIDRDMKPPEITDIFIGDIDLADYDGLLEHDKELLAI
jgi:hypothetical protein